MSPQPIPERVSTLVIGGGPAGIVSLKYVQEYGHKFGLDKEVGGETSILVEMESEIGGTFKGYENAELVSSKQLTCFSDFRYPLDSSDHPSLPNFVQYLNDYASKFSLWPNIHTSTKVIHLDRISASENLGGYLHRATIQRVKSDGKGEIFTVIARKVVITTGLHVTPNIPLIPGLNVDPTPNSPEWIHSSSYKSRSQVRGKEVLVLGSGETGMDVAYESVLSPAKRVSMGIRGGFLSFPKVLNNFKVLGSTFDGNLPIDGLITNLFETAYVHPWVAASHLRWFVSDFVIRRVLWALTGTQAGCNQWAGELPPEKQGRAFVFLNKSAKAMQFINQPYRKMSKLHQALAHYIDPEIPKGVEDPTIHMVPFPNRFDESGKAIFPPPPEHRKKEMAWKEDCRPDLVVLCTGYKQDFSWLGEGYSTPDKVDVRGIVDSKDTSVGYIGFLRPGVGAIPPMAEMQIQLFLLLSTQSVPIPTSKETYHLLHSPNGRIQYGVDYSTYQAQLARDIGAAPGLKELWLKHGWFVVFIYCFGAAFPTFYRLTGPYESPSAPGIVKTELWDTIKRRGVIGNIFMGVIPMAFYALINLLAYVLEMVWVFAAPLFGYRYERLREDGMASKGEKIKMI